jgi:hypothetical protein
MNGHHGHSKELLNKLRYSPAVRGPEKTPIRDFAIIFCGRCKERYQASIVILKGRVPETLICPRCASVIIVTMGSGAQVPPGRAPLPMVTTSNPLTMICTINPNNED